MHVNFESREVDQPLPSTKTWQLQMGVGRDECVKVAFHMRLSFLSYFIGDKEEVDKRNVRIAELAV